MHLLVFITLVVCSISISAHSITKPSLINSTSYTRSEHPDGQFRTARTPTIGTGYNIYITAKNAGAVTYFLLQPLLIPCIRGAHEIKVGLPLHTYNQQRHAMIGIKNAIAEHSRLAPELTAKIISAITLNTAVLAPEELSSASNRWGTSAYPTQLPFYNRSNWDVESNRLHDVYHVNIHTYLEWSESQIDIRAGLNMDNLPAIMAFLKGHSGLRRSSNLSLFIYGKRAFAKGIRSKAKERAKILDSLLKELAASLGAERFTSFILGDLQLPNLPKSIRAFTRTEYLDLSNNHLTEIPRHTLATLTSLQTLRLASNKIQRLPSRWSPPTLTCLSLAYNPLQNDAFENISALRLLKWLDIFIEKPLTVVPVCIEELQRNGSVVISNLAPQTPNDFLQATGPHTSFSRQVRSARRSRDAR